ncbi:hypothetical protein GCM10027444_38050 [Actinopolyspora lacussalsi]
MISDASATPPAYDSLAREHGQLPPRVRGSTRGAHSDSTATVPAVGPGSASSFSNVGRDAVRGISIVRTCPPVGGSHPVIALYAPVMLSVVATARLLTKPR